MLEMMLQSASLYLVLEYLQIPGEGIPRNKVTGKTESWNLTLVFTDWSAQSASSGPPNKVFSN